MARNRKRAKERRSRRPQPAPQSRLATARSEHEDHDAPDPIAHAAPDVELAEVQMALGRPELNPTPESESEDVEQELEDERGGPSGGGPGRGGVEGGDLVPSDAAHPARAAPSGNRLINFLQGSWRELQRVQWPDRRQVLQATSVVIGFVIVAGVYLGVADWAAGKIVNLIIK